MSSPEQKFQAIEGEEERREVKPREYRKQEPVHTLNFEQLSPQVHRWIDRGAVMSCEGAGHPTHRTFKTLR